MSGIRGALMQQLLQWIPASVVGKVTAVQAPATCTVEPIDGGAVFYKVRLRGTADGDDSGVYAEPKVDSYVIISPLNHDDTQMWVSRFTEVEKWHVRTNSGSKVEVLANGEVHLNGDSKGALVVVSDLVTKLNTLENDLNTIKAVFSAWTPVPNDGGAALKGAASTWAGQTLTNTTAANIQNTKVKHGA